nr:uncharacterized protein LOC104108049 [Nicotiana tomentosiformis]
MEFSEEAAATSSIANLSNDSESVLPVLPLEIIHEILLILPVKALLKMRDPAKFVNGKLHWTKVVSVPYFATSEYAIRPIFISQNDDILMQYSTQNALKHSEIQIHDDSGVQFNLYIESLVSPNFVEEV